MSSACSAAPTPTDSVRRAHMVHRPTLRPTRALHHSPYPSLALGPQRPRLFGCAYHAQRDPDALGCDHERQQLLALPALVRTVQSVQRGVDRGERRRGLGGDICRRLSGRGSIRYVFIRLLRLLIPKISGTMAHAQACRAWLARELWDRFDFTQLAWELLFTFLLFG